MEARRVLTGYCLPLDQATVDLLRGSVLDTPNTLGGAFVREGGLEYVVLRSCDNEYVHKAVKNLLRKAIHEAKSIAKN